MVPDHEFDDLLRTKLDAVVPPSPPAMDWSTMARAAQAGVTPTPDAAVAPRALMMWKVVIGTAVVAGIIGLGMNVTQAPVERVLADNVDFPTEGPSTMGAGHSITELVSSEARSVGIDASLSGSFHKMLRVEERQRAPEVKAADQSPRVHSATTTSKDPYIAPTRLGHQTKAAGTHEESALRSGPGPDEADLVARSPKVSAGRTAFVDGVVIHGPAPTIPGSAADRAYEGGQRSVDSHFIIERLDPIVSLGEPLLMKPTAHAVEPVQAASFSRFTLSPWMSVGRPMHSKAKGQLAEQAESLGELNEWLGTVGLRVEYAFTKRIAVISGFQYARKGQLNGTITTSALESTDYRVSGTYWEVPIAVKYTIPCEGLDLYLRAGALLQFNARSNSDRVVVHDEVRKEMSTLTLATGSMGPAVDVGAGVRFRLGRGVGLFLEPTYQYALSPVVKNLDFDQLPYNPHIHGFGLATGLSFQFHSR